VVCGVAVSVVELVTQTAVAYACRSSVLWLLCKTHNEFVAVVRSGDQLEISRERLPLRNAYKAAGQRMNVCVNGGEKRSPTVRGGGW
jgi:hypothetical protein